MCYCIPNYVLSKMGIIHTSKGKTAAVIYLEPLSSPHQLKKTSELDPSDKLSGFACADT